MVYRYPGLVPLLEVSGTHYEMGLQYGVLLRPEIKNALESYERIFTWTASTLGSPAHAFHEMIRKRTEVLLKKLPGRFVEELQGVSEGAGLAFEDVGGLFIDL